MNVARRSPLAVVCYVARAHGLSAVHEVLRCPRYNLAAIVTHRRLPKAEDPQRSERPDFQEFAALARHNDVPLLAVDDEASERAAVHDLARLQFELVASVSWRRLLTPEQLAQPKIGGVNLHRGALPKYAGAEPVLRALRDGAPEIEICAHVLTPQIDGGEVLERVRFPVKGRPGEELIVHAERIKHEITPLFGPLLIRALDTLVTRNEH
jgi:methionyl-tRNA formyltransferase